MSRRRREVADGLVLIPVLLTRERVPKLAHASTERPTHLRQSFRTKNEEHHEQKNHELPNSDASGHDHTLAVESSAAARLPSASAPLPADEALTHAADAVAAVLAPRTKWKGR